MESIKLNCIDFKNLFEVIRSLKAKDSLVLIEFNTNDNVEIKTVNSNGNYLRCITISFEDNFIIEDEKTMTDNIFVVVNNKKLLEILMNSKSYSSCILELNYNNLNTCESIKFNLSDSNGNHLSTSLECNNTESFKDIIGKKEQQFVKEDDILFRFFLDRKLTNMLSNCKDNILNICLVRKELGLILTLGDADYVIVPLYEINIDIEEEIIVSIDNRYLGNLNFPSSLRNTYYVNVTKNLLYLYNDKVSEFIIIRSM